jgi:hypothetical protein
MLFYWQDLAGNDLKKSSQPRHFKDKRITNAVPFSPALSTSNVPPCPFVTISEANDSPSPVPCPVGLVVKRAGLSRLKKHLHGQFILDGIVEVLVFLHAIAGEHRQEKVLPGAGFISENMFSGF